MQRKDTEWKVIYPAENIDTKHNERPPQSTASKAMDKRVPPQVNAKTRKLHHNEIRMDQQKTRPVIACKFLILFMFYTHDTKV